MEEIAAFHSEVFLGSRQGMRAALTLDVVNGNVPEGVTAAQKVRVNPHARANLTRDNATVTEWKRDAVIGMAGNDKYGGVDFEAIDVERDDITIFDLQQSCAGGAE